MKNYYFFFLLILFYSCSEDDTSIPEEKPEVAIKFVSSLPARFFSNLVGIIKKQSVVEKTASQGFTLLSNCWLRIKSRTLGQALVSRIIIFSFETSGIVETGELNIQGFKTLQEVSPYSSSLVQKTHDRSENIREFVAKPLSIFSSLTS